MVEVDERTGAFCNLQKDDDLSVHSVRYFMDHDQLSRVNALVPLITYRFLVARIRWDLSGRVMIEVVVVTELI
jgi:citrate lyase synthetase